MKSSTLADAVRNLPDEEVASIARELPDDILVTALGLALSRLKSNETKSAKVERRAPPRRASEAEPVRKSASRKGQGTNPKMDAEREAVYKVLVGADEPMRCREIASAAGLASDRCGRVLTSLRLQGRAKTEGKGPAGRWSVAL